MIFINYKKILIVLLVCILLLVGIALVLNNYSAENQAKREELEKLFAELYEQEMIKIEQNEIRREEEKKEHAKKELVYSPYEKLGDKTMLTSVFYLGDRNAYGAGLRDMNLSWKVLLKDKFLTLPGISFRIEGTQSIEKPDGGTFSYLDRLFEAYKAAYKLDLLFLCVGTDGEEENFGAKYEAIVRKAKVFNKNADVVCIIEHNQTDSEAEAILRISEYYETLCVDMRPVFEGKDGLTFEDGFPNVEGHELYCEEIFRVLKAAVDEKRGAKECKEKGLYLTDAQTAEIDKAVEQ